MKTYLVLFVQKMIAMWVVFVCIVGIIYTCLISQVKLVNFYLNEQEKKLKFLHWINSADKVDLNWNLYKLLQTLPSHPTSVSLNSKAADHRCAVTYEPSSVVFTNSPCLHLVITRDMTAIRSLCSGLTVWTCFEKWRLKPPPPPPAALCSHKTHDSMRVKYTQVKLTLCFISHIFA